MVCPQNGTAVLKRLIDHDLSDVLTVFTLSLPSFCPDASHAQGIFKRGRYTTEGSGVHGGFLDGFDENR